MKPSECQKYGAYLKKLTTEEIEKLLASVLHEMRRRDTEHMKAAVFASSLSLSRVRVDD